MLQVEGTVSQCKVTWAGEEGKERKQEQDSEHGGRGQGGGREGDDQEGGRGVDFTSAEALEALKMGQ